MYLVAINDLSAAFKVISIINYFGKSKWINLILGSIGFITQYNKACWIESLIITMSYGGIFRNTRGFVKGCFSSKLGNGFALEAELFAAMKAISIAFEKDWRYLWIESDSMYIVSLLKSGSDALANCASDFSWWHYPPDFFLQFISRDFLGFKENRFV